MKLLSIDVMMGSVIDTFPKAPFRLFEEALSYISSNVGNSESDIMQFILLKEDVLHLKKTGKLPEHKYKELEKRLLYSIPQYILFYPYTYVYPTVCRLKDIIKKILPDVKFIIGNVHATAVPGDCINDGFDYAVVGHGFEVIPHIVAGNVYKGVVVNYLTPEAAKVISFSPNILKDGVIELPLGNKKIKSARILTSFGCPNKCIFCKVPVITPEWMERPNHVVISEIASLYMVYGIRQFLLMDPNPMPKSGSYERLLNIFRGVKEVLGESPIYQIESRVDTLVKLYQQNPAAIKEVFTYISRLLVGIESISQTALIEYNKEIDLKGITAFLEIIKHLDTPVTGHFVIGANTDTLDTVDNIIEFSNKHSIFPTLSTATPYPGTRFFNTLNQEGKLITTDWDLYDSKNLVFKHPNLKPDDLKKKIDTSFSEFLRSSTFKFNLKFEENKIKSVLS